MLAVFPIFFMPSQVFVDANHVDVFGQAVLDAELFALDQAGGSGQPRRVRRFGGLGQRAHKGQPCIAVFVLVTHAPHNDRRAVTVAPDQFHQLVAGIRQRGRVGEGDGPVDRTENRICASFAPSIVAASRMDFGMVWKNCSNRKNWIGPRARNRMMPL